MTEDVARRLYHALVAELRRREHLGNQPVTVGEIYQHLVPYQAVRAELALDLNADYEHALLRLLAGEGDLLRLESARAREKLRREAKSAFPAVGLFREYAESRVWVAMPESDPDPVPASDEPPGPAQPEPDPAGRPEETARREPVARAEGATRGGECAFCGEPLPRGHAVSFCPFCGGDQGLRPCPRCDAVLERGWRYCINCGHEVGRG